LASIRIPVWATPLSTPTLWCPTGLAMRRPSCIPT